MSEYSATQYKLWYDKNKERIRPNKKVAKKKYRRTEAGKAAQRRYNAKPSRRIYVKNRNFLKNYGITLIEYEQLLIEKDSRCDICAKQSKVLHVDHCHTTGKMRGLLCGNCNRGLGLLKDNPFFLHKAIEYLKDVQKDNGN